MNTMIFSSGNAGKLREVRHFFADMGIEILSLSEVGLDGFEVEEDRDSLEGNAEKKALELFDLVGKPVFSDDTGLFVDALNGAPGVYSARYAGEGADFQANRTKMLRELQGVPAEKRTARFKTVICYVDQDRTVHFFEGRIDGHILEAEAGDQGFGYDSIFCPEGEQRSFGEMSVDEKAGFSHRVRALAAFKEFMLELRK